MKKKKEEITLFTFLNQIQTKRRTIPYDCKIAPAYVLSLFLSMNKRYISYVNRINKYQFILPDEVIYNYYMSVIPEGKYYSKFIKKRPENNKYKKRVDKIRDIYPELSLKEAKMIISFLEK